MRNRINYNEKQINKKNASLISKFTTLIAEIKGTQRDRAIPFGRTNTQSLI